MKWKSIVLGLLLVVSLPALAEEEGDRPTAPEKPAATAKPSPAPVTGRAAASAITKKKRSKHNSYQNQDLQLAPAPLMIQKP